MGLVEAVITEACYLTILKCVGLSMSRLWGGMLRRGEATGFMCDLILRCCAWGVTWCSEQEWEHSTTVGQEQGSGSINGEAKGR